MREVTRALNPECKHLPGDKRTVRLGGTFDAVFVHDAVMYMTTEEDLPVRQARWRALAPILAARDHAAFSAMVYAGLRIEETTALGVEDLSFSRGEEEIRVARGKGNKERVVPMSPKLKRSLKRYLKVRDQLLVPGEAPLPHLFLNEKGE